MPNATPWRWTSWSLVVGLALCPVAPHPATAEPAAKHYPKTVHAALLVGELAEPTDAERQGAEAVLRAARQGLGDLPMVGPAVNPERVWAPAKVRGWMGDLHVLRDLAKAKWGHPQTRDLVHGVFDDLVARGHAAFGLPLSAGGHFALVSYSSTEYAKTLPSGAIVIPEQEVSAARVAAELRREIAATNHLVLAMLMNVRDHIAAKRCPATCTTPAQEGDDTVAKAILATTLAHELGHRMQLIAHSRPKEGWPDPENQVRELEADAVGLWLGACAGWPLHHMMLEYVTLGAMDALARSMGMQDDNYPRWEQRVSSAYRVAAEIAQTPAKGTWPAACAPLAWDATQLLPQAEVSEVLTQLTSKDGVARLLGGGTGRKKPRK